MKCKCPLCGKELTFSKVSMSTMGAVCSHGNFDVKIYLQGYVTYGGFGDE